jgi:putative sterol carrier protein
LGLKSTYSLREFRPDDAASLEALLRTTFPCFREDDMFTWKYERNPELANSLVIIAEKEGELVGSNYWISRRLQLMKNLSVNAALAADIAVNPKERGNGVGTKLLLYPRLSGAFKKNKIVVSYMFSGQELSKRLYKPAAGYIAAPRGTTTYRKLFTCNELKEIFEKINAAVESSEELKRKVAELAMCVSFKLRGVPEFSLSITPEKICISEGTMKEADVVIEGSLPISSLMLKGDFGLRKIMKAFLLGKVKVRKGLRNILKMRQAIELFQVALDHKSP